MDNNILMELVIFEDVLTALVSNMASGGDDNKGVQFKVNTNEKWAGTIGLRCNHIHTTALPRYLGTVVHGLVAAQRIGLWEHTSIARCFEIMRESGRKVHQPQKRNMYFTFRPSDELYQRLRRVWSDDRFVPIKLLLGKLKEWQEEVAQ